MRKMKEELKKTGYFRRLKIRGGTYWFPCASAVAAKLPKEQVFFGTFDQALKMGEKFRLAR